MFRVRKSQESAEESQEISWKDLCPATIYRPVMVLISPVPELFPIGFEPSGPVSFVRMAEADYAAASFLDGRIRPRHPVVEVLPFDQVAIAAAELPERCDYIFHIGHVGSTLLSRLLGTQPPLLSLREPEVLRSLAQIPDNTPYTGTFLKLLSRTFRPEQRALIKATSFVSEIAGQLMARPSHAKAIGIFVSPPIYLATILAGQNSRKEAQIYFRSRHERLARRAGGELPPVLSEGEAIALGWACEMSALAQARSDRMLWMEFDHLLEHPKTALAAAFRHLNVDVPDGNVAAVATGPDMQRYSKAPEYPYDAQLRHAILDTAKREHAVQIKRGLAWLEKAAQLQCVKDALELRGAL